MKIQDEQLKRGHLKSLGIFAGRIAHEFNNILTGMLGNLSLAKQMAEDNNDLVELIISAQEAAERAKNVTAQLFSVSRDGIIIKMLTPLIQTLQRSIDETFSKSNYQVHLDIAKDLWLIEVDEEQIVQLFNQILINAKEAMPNSGSIFIKAENHPIEGPINLPLKPNDYIAIKFHDEGVGIPKTVISKVFDPFFTTKSNHSGLGLSSAFSVAITHDGLITAKSEEGKGTTITVYLPAIRRTEPEIKESITSIKQKTKSSRILVMDDEELICKVAQKVLKFLGFKGAIAQTGEDAIMMFRQANESGEPFDVVILDLTVPNGMGAVECLKELQKIDLDVKAIVSTGFTHHPIMSNFQESGFKAVLAKPYTSTELETVLAKILK
jgi:CheY-like chemotaxis protein